MKKSHDQRLSFAQSVALAVLAAGSCSIPAVQAQDCLDSVRLTTPTQRFTLNADGTALDTRTGLQWQRCPLGYALDDNGSPELGSDDRCVTTETARLYTWQGALQVVQSLNQSGGLAGQMDWQLPTNTQLESIVERQCINPAINLAVFPEAGVRRAWSSTISIGSTFGVGVSFAEGDMTSFQFRREFGDENNVRLVRTP